MKREPINPADLVHQVATRMRAANLDWERSTAWTKTLKDSLRNLLETEGTDVTEVLYSSHEHDRHEFLLDLVVWDRSDGLKGVILAAESEWYQSLDAVAEDFWKLLVVKSPLKLMVFACNKKPRKFSQDAVWAKLSDCLLRYRDHTLNERYIFMDYAPQPGKKAWWVEIQRSGRLDAVPDRNWVQFD